MTGSVWWWQARQQQADACEGLHLFVCQHGLWGSPADVAYLEAYLQHNGWATLNARSNSARCTFDGADVCGDRLAAEVEAHVAVLAEAGTPVKRISFAAYSFGGLIARYAVGKLWAGGFFQQVVPVNFLTIASPHLGCWESPNSMTQLAYNSILPWTLSRTGRQLMLADRWLEPEGLPLLAAMARPDCAFWAALAAFQKRVLLADVAMDRTVPYTTAAIALRNPYHEAAAPEGEGEGLAAGGRAGGAEEEGDRVEEGGEGEGEGAAGGRMAAVEEDSDGGAAGWRAAARQQAAALQPPPPVVGSLSLRGLLGAKQQAASREGCSRAAASSTIRRSGYGSDGGVPVRRAYGSGGEGAGCGARRGSLVRAASVELPPRVSTPPPPPPRAPMIPLPISSAYPCIVQPHPAPEPSPPPMSYAVQPATVRQGARGLHHVPSAPASCGGGSAASGREAGTGWSRWGSAGRGVVTAAAAPCVAESAPGAGAAGKAGAGAGGGAGGADGDVGDAEGLLQGAGSAPLPVAAVALLCEAAAWVLAGVSGGGDAGGRAGRAKRGRRGGGGGRGAAEPSSCSSDTDGPGGGGGAGGLTRSRSERQGYFSQAYGRWYGREAPAAESRTTWASPPGRPTGRSASPPARASSLPVPVVGGGAARGGGSSGGARRLSDRQGRRGGGWGWAAVGGGGSSTDEVLSSRARLGIFLALLPLLLSLWLCMVAWLAAICVHHYAVLLTVRPDRGWEVRVRGGEGGGGSAAGAGAGGGAARGGAGVLAGGVRVEGAAGVGAGASCRAAGGGPVVSWAAARRPAGKPPRPPRGGAGSGSRGGSRRGSCGSGCGDGDAAMGSGQERCSGGECSSTSGGGGGAGEGAPGSCAGRAAVGTGPDREARRTAFDGEDSQAVRAAVARIFAAVRASGDAAGGGGDARCAALCGDTAGVHPLVRDLAARVVSRVVRRAALREAGGAFCSNGGAACRAAVAAAAGEEDEGAAGAAGGEEEESGSAVDGWLGGEGQRAEALGHPPSPQTAAPLQQQQGQHPHQLQQQHGGRPCSAAPPARPQAVQPSAPQPRADPAKLLPLMVAQLNSLQWQKVDVDTRHYHAHAAIVVRSSRHVRTHSHIIDYAVRQLKL